MKSSERLTRSDEITHEYFVLLDKHLADLVAGKATLMLQLNQIAQQLFISPKHLSQTIQFTQGQSPCYFYDQKIVEQAKQLLINTELSVADIARTLTYDPSNFSKFFKKIAGITPGQFRENNKK